jgi:hypothetical protein
VLFPVIGGDNGASETWHSLIDASCFNLLHTLLVERFLPDQHSSDLMAQNPPKDLQD